jgi:hypothetical protein
MQENGFLICLYHDKYNTKPPFFLWELRKHGEICIPLIPVNQFLTGSGKSPVYCQISTKKGQIVLFISLFRSLLKKGKTAKI